jgi:hypothetical protein
MIIKLLDSYLGIGDHVFDKEVQICDAEEFLKSKYKDTKALLLDFIKADPQLDTHSFDIVTIL